MFHLRHELSSTFDDIFNSLQLCAHNIYVNRFDLAVDVPVVRSKIQLFKDNRKYSQLYKSPEDFTEYLGNVNSAGRVKVYNKQLESDLPYELTRVEVTCDDYNYELFCKRFPKVYIREYINLGQENITVQLLNELPSDRLDFYFRQMSLNSRKKYKALLVEKPFEVSKKAYDHVITMCQSFEL